MGTSGRRPGRVQRIAYDATPLNAANPDIEARTGWLLAMTRLHHPSAELQDGRRFVEALADAGLPTSRSLLSRWESGEIPVSYEGMQAYEQVLGLEPGRISSLSGYIRASLPGVRARVVRPKLDPADRDFARRFDDLLEMAEDGAAQARDWQELGWHFSMVPLVHLRRTSWEALVHKLVTELPRSVKVAYRQYSTAAMNLAAVPRAQGFLLDAIKSYVSNPDVQVVTNPMGLLDQLPTRAAARFALDVIADPPNDSVFRAAVWCAAMKLVSGQFTIDERSELGVVVLRIWRQNPARAGEELAELIAKLPEGIRSTLVQAATTAGRRNLGYVVEHGEEVVAPGARGLARDLAEAARDRVPQEPQYAEDRMLARLIRETLFHRDSERRHLAALLISASPFGEPVAEELLRVLADEALPTWVRVRAATLVRYLSTDDLRMRMLAFVNHPVDEIATPVTQGLGHLAPTALADQALRNSLGREWSLRERAKLYALGMTGSPGLQAILRSRDAAEWQRSAARWWSAQGPAIRE
jgi:transcriptional regulator with XRE-family HTH domain